MRDGRDRPNEKLRDMVRSVLPSTRRRTARADKVELHRHCRRHAHIATDLLARRGETAPVDPHQAENEDVRDTEGGNKYYAAAVKSIVRERRWGDKLGGFLRWAREISAHLDSDEDKFYFVKSKLGSSLIKDHALGHFIRIESARNPTFARSILDFPEPRIYRPYPWQNKTHLTRLLRDAIELDHAGINRFLRKNGIQVPRPGACTDEPGKSCWLDALTDRRVHDREVCRAASLVQCVALDRARPGGQPCWSQALERSHQEHICRDSRRYVMGPADALLLAPTFHVKQRRSPDMKPREAALARYLADLGLVPS